MPYFLASYPITGVMMPTGQKPNGPHWMTATTQILDARTASMTSTTETGDAIPTTLWTGEPEPCWADSVHIDLSHLVSLKSCFLGEKVQGR